MRVISPLITVFLLFSCGFNNRTVVKDMITDNMSALDVKWLMDHDPRILVLDIRSLPSYESSHIPGAVHARIDKLSDLKNKYPVYKTIIIYHTESVPQKDARAYLIHMGFLDVRVLSGGYYSWVNAGLPVEKD